MHIFNLLTQMSALYKFSVHDSDVLRWISVGLLPTEKPAAHVTALWRFLVMFYPPRVLYVKSFIS